MTMPAENENLWNEAMALLLRWQSAPDDPQAREDIVAFCARSEEHRTAWDRAKHLYRLTGEATGAPTRARKRKKARDVTRRSMLTGVCALAVGAGIVKGPDLWRRWQADLVTEVGRIDRRTLADGSRLTLGPDSAVQVAFSPAHRRIKLIEGMALLEVANDRSRPFQARTANLIATAGAGMSFEIRQNGGRSLVGVDTGRVSVALDGVVDGDDVLTAGDWLSKGPGRNAKRRGHRDAGQVAAWRQRLLIADQERIDWVVAEIARWQSGRVIIAQSGLASSRVSGLYDLGDPQAALEAVVGPYGGRVRRVTPWLTILSTI